MNKEEHDNFNRRLTALMKLLTELRPLLSDENLDDKAINTACKRVRTFVLKETGSGPWGHIFRWDERDVDGECLKEGSLPRHAQRIWPTMKGFSDSEVAEWMPPDTYEDLIDLLDALFQFSQDRVPSRLRRERANQLRDRASDFVELHTGEPWEPKSDTPPMQGVSLLDAARIFEGSEPQNAAATKKRWKRSSKLPVPIGKAVGHRQMDLFNVKNLSAFIRDVEGAGCWKPAADKKLQAQIREAVPIQNSRRKPKPRRRKPTQPTTKSAAQRIR